MLLEREEQQSYSLLPRTENNGRCPRLCVLSPPHPPCCFLSSLSTWTCRSLGILFISPIPLCFCSSSRVSRDVVCVTSVKPQAGIATLAPFPSFCELLARFPSLAVLPSPSALRSALCSALCSRPVGAQRLFVRSFPLLSSGDLRSLRLACKLNTAYSSILPRLISGWSNEAAGVVERLGHMVPVVGVRAETALAGQRRRTMRRVVSAPAALPSCAQSTSSHRGPQKALPPPPEQRTSSRRAPQKALVPLPERVAVASPRSAVPEAEEPRPKKRRALPVAGSTSHRQTGIRMYFAPQAPQLPRVNQVEQSVQARDPHTAPAPAAAAVSSMESPLSSSRLSLAALLPATAATSDQETAAAPLVAATTQPAHDDLQAGTVTVEPALEATALQPPVNVAVPDLALADTTNGSQSHGALVTSSAFTPTYSSSAVDVNPRSSSPLTDHGRASHSLTPPTDHGSATFHSPAATGASRDYLSFSALTEADADSQPFLALTGPEDDSLRYLTANEQESETRASVSCATPPIDALDADPVAVWDAPLSQPSPPLATPDLAVQPLETSAAGTVATADMTLSAEGKTSAVDTVATSQATLPPRVMTSTVDIVATSHLASSPEVKATAVDKVVTPTLRRCSAVPCAITSLPLTSAAAVGEPAPLTLEPSDSTQASDADAPPRSTPGAKARRRRERAAQLAAWRQRNQREAREARVARRLREGRSLRSDTGAGADERESSASPDEPDRPRRVAFCPFSNVTMRYDPMAPLVASACNGNGNGGEADVDGNGNGAGEAVDRGLAAAATESDSAACRHGASSPRALAAAQEGDLQGLALQGEVSV